MDERAALRALRERAPRVHCMTNPVTMRDVANVLLAAGGSAIMAENEAEAAEITALCDATLLNTGVPSEAKFRAFCLAGERANALGHPLVLDPVGAGASAFRREGLRRLLQTVQPSVIRCNQEEALALLSLREETGQAEPFVSGGVESGVLLPKELRQAAARRLARAYRCAVLVSGTEDVVSDGERLAVLTGGDARIRRVTGSGCMLSALCALFAGAGSSPWEAAYFAGTVWKESSKRAAARLAEHSGGIGSFFVFLLDALEAVCLGSGEEAGRV